jgi:hypothetical protein
VSTHQRAKPHERPRRQIERPAPAAEERVGAREYRHRQSRDSQQVHFGVIRHADKEHVEVGVQGPDRPPDDRRHRDDRDHHHRKHQHTGRQATPGQTAFTESNSENHQTATQRRPPANLPNRPDN